MTGSNAVAYALLITAKEPLARLSQEALERAGFHVQLETTGARAQVQLAFTNPDLVVLDLNLPDMPGENILRQLNAPARLCRTKGAPTRLILLVEENLTAPQTPQVAPESVLAQPFAAPELTSLASQVLGG